MFFGRAAAGVAVGGAVVVPVTVLDALGNIGFVVVVIVLVVIFVALGVARKGAASVFGILLVPRYVATSWLGLLARREGAVSVGGLGSGHPVAGWCGSWASRFLSNLDDGGPPDSRGSSRMALVTLSQVQIDLQKPLVIDVEGVVERSGNLAILVIRRRVRSIVVDRYPFVLQQGKSDSKGL